MMTARRIEEDGAACKRGRLLRRVEPEAKDANCASIGCVPVELVPVFDWKPRRIQRPSRRGSIVALVVGLMLYPIYSSESLAAPGSTPKKAVPAGEYSFGRFYDEMWQGTGYSDQDRKVCREIVKQLNITNSGPSVCLPTFGPESPIENFRWRQADSANSLRYEGLRLSGSKSTVCNAATANSVDVPALRDAESGGVRYETLITDIENRGNAAMVVKRIDSSRQCDVEKDYVMPLGERLYFVCEEGPVGTKPYKLIEIGGQDGFSYRGKQYLFEWHGRLNHDGYANVDELLPVVTGNEVFHATRQICRINYHDGAPK